MQRKQRICTSGRNTYGDKKAGTLRCRSIGIYQQIEVCATVSAYAADESPVGIQKEFNSRELNVS